MGVPQKRDRTAPFDGWNDSDLLSAATQLALTNLSLTSLSLNSSCYRAPSLSDRLYKMAKGQVGISGGCGVGGYEGGVLVKGSKDLERVMWRPRGLTSRKCGCNT